MKTNNNPKRNLLLAVMLLFALVLLLASCTGEGETSADTTTESAIESTLDTTPDSTTVSSPESSTEKTPDTTVDDTWEEKLAEGLYEKATLDDGKYYVYIDIAPESYDAEARLPQDYVGNREDIFTTYFDDRWSRTLGVRATKEEIEAYAKLPNVTSIKPFDKSASVSVTDVIYHRFSSLEEAYVYPYAENKAFAEVNGHCPILKFDSVEGYESFTEALCRLYEPVPQVVDSLKEELSRFDEAFFDENILLCVHVSAGSGSFRFSVLDVSIAQKQLLVNVNFHSQRPGYGVTDDMQYGFLLISIAKEALAGVESYDAVWAGTKKTSGGPSHNGETKITNPESKQGAFNEVSGTYSICITLKSVAEQDVTTFTDAFVEKYALSEAYVSSHRIYCAVSEEKLTLLLRDDAVETLSYAFSLAENPELEEVPWEDLIPK